MENEFKNTYIKCKYTGCKESVNLYDYEEHLKVCPFKNIKDSLEIDNLVYFDSLPFNQDPYSNSVLMNYSVKKAENDINLNYDSSYVNYYESIEKNYTDLLHGKSDLAQNEIFKNIIENDKLLEDDIDALEARKNEVNDIVKELQNKINLNEIA